MPSPKKKQKRESSQCRPESDDEDVPLSRLFSVERASDSDDEPLISVQQQIRSSNVASALVQTSNSEAEEELTHTLDEIVCQRALFKKPDITFIGGTEATPDQLTTPLEYFREMVTDSIEHAAEQTNIFFTEKTGAPLGTCTTKTEIDLLIGPYLRMGLIQSYSVQAFWDGDIRISVIADHMARNSFEKIVLHLHFVNNLDVSEEVKNNQIDVIVGFVFFFFFAGSRFCR